MNPRRIITPIVLVACLAASALAADDISIEAKLSKRICFLRGSVQLRVIYRGIANPPQPTIPTIAGPADGITVEFRGSNLSPRRRPYDPARLKRPVTFYFNLTARKLGQYKIPSLAFRANSGDKILTAPLTLTVVQPPKQDVILCEMIANKTDVYLHEAIQITLKVYTKSGALIRGAEGKGGVVIKWLRQLPGLVPVDDVQRHEKLEKLGAIRRSGRAYRAEGISRIVFPTELGERTIPRATIDFECYKRFLPPRTTVIPDPAFSDAFGARRGSDAWHPMLAESNELAIRVRPFPEEGKPEGFKGAVGQFDMIATVSGRKAKVGEPITLTTIIRGSGYPGTIDAPYPQDAKGFKVYSGDQDTKAKRSTNRIEVTKTFKTFFEPQTTAVKAIPKILFHYFDPQAEKYVTRAYGPTPITVSPASRSPQVAASTVATQPTSTAAASPPPAPAPVTPPPQRLKGDIQPIITDASKLRDQSRLVIQEDWFVPSLIAPLLLAALCAAVQHYRERLQTDRAFARSTFAVRNAKQHLSAANTALAAGDAREFYALLFKAITEYIGDKLNVAAATVTSQSVSDALTERGLDEKLIAEAETCLEECEQGRFAPETAEADSMLMRQTKALLKRLERSL